MIFFVFHQKTDSNSSSQEKEAEEKKISVLDTLRATLKSMQANKDTGAQNLLKKISHYYATDDLELTLNMKELNDDDIKILTKALSQEPYPIGTILNLCDNHISNNGINTLCEFIKSKHCPEGLELILYYNKNISQNGIESLTSSIKKRPALITRCDVLDDDKKPAQSKLNHTKADNRYGLPFNLP